MPTPMEALHSDAITAEINLHLAGKAKNPLPPKLWPHLQARLQEIYRTATDLPSANLNIMVGDYRDMIGKKL